MTTLRSKILVAIGSTLVSVGAVFWGGFYFALNKNYVDYEQRDASLDVQNLTNQISREAENFTKEWLDWTRWDEMYQYVKTGNARFLRSSLAQVQFQDNQISLVAILNREGKIIFATNYNPQTGEQSTLSDATKALLQNPKWQINNRDKRLTGIVEIDNQPMLITVQPITPSNGKAPVGGILIAGKILNLAWFKDLQLPKRLQPSVKVVKNITADSDDRIALKYLNNGVSSLPNFLGTTSFQPSQPIYIRALNSDRLVGYTFLPGLEQKSAFLLRLEVPRLDYERVTSALLTMLGLIVFCAIGFSVTILWLVEKLILSNLLKVTNEVQRIGCQPDLSQRIANQSNDEIGTLIVTINTMLEAIEFRRSMQFQMEQEKEILLNINQAISSAGDFETALAIALVSLGDITNSVFGEVWIVSADGLVLHCDSIWYSKFEQQNSKIAESIREFRHFSEGITLLPNEELPGLAWQSLKPEYQTNLDYSDSLSLRQELALKCGFNGHICLPILKGEDPNTIKRNKEEKIHDRELMAIFSYFSTDLVDTAQSSLKLATDMISHLGVGLSQKQTEAELRALFAAMEDAIMVIDAQGYYLKIAPTNTNLLARRPEELLGKRIHDVFDKEKADQFMEYIKRSLNNQESINFEYTLELNGKTIWFATSISPITEDSVLLVARDISDRKVAEFALQEALAAAKVASRAKSDFLSNMSHELRTPLNAILGFTQLMRYDDTLNFEQQDRLQIISRSGEHLLSLINDVLEMSKIESGRANLNPSNFDLFQLVQDLKDMLRLRAEAKGLYLEVHQDSQVPQFIYSDEMKLRQVLINILGNGIKFTQSGGISLGITCKANQNSDLNLKFVIKDTGYGISEDEVGRIFEPFIQSESGRKSSEGTGLGLPISRTFVKMMGGDIEVTSKLTEGTIFSFNIEAQIVTLPNQIAKAASLSLAESALGGALKANSLINGANDKQTIAILLAEDNIVNQKVALQMLKRLGYKADVAINGLEVLKTISTKSYHLILMDVQMPEMDGIEATIAIRAQEQESGCDPLKIIAMTANAMLEDRDRCLEIGMNDHLSKPVRIEELQACIEKWI